MDASNPVIVSERVKFSEMKNDYLLLRRQNFEVLEQLTKEGKRREPERHRLEEHPVDPAVMKRLITSGVLPLSNDKLDPPLTIQKDMEGKPARILPSEKYHSRGVNMLGAYTAVKRNFVSRKRLEGVLEPLLKFNPEAAQLIEKVTYTGGTKSGFSRRLAKWADRKPKMMKAVLEKWALNPYEILRECMPLKGDLLDWNMDANDLLDTITVNRSSSAGPPFFQQKALVQDRIYEALEEIITKISDGTIKDFFHKNPEFLISECKNKMDRYEMDKVQEKTRPYWCFSAPICMLLSILCQDFCKNLATFDVNKASVNAYGFSYAHGGGKRMWEWMRDVPEGKTKVCIYGDDVKKVVRKDGLLYQINPDFEQMDGSLDKDTIDITVNWIYKSYQLKYGDNDFFRYICEMWKELAIGSSFLVDGVNVYSNKTGLLTGIVGTTLFDTVKSVLAYYLFEYEKIDPFDVKASTAFFATLGLKVKDGTWDPQLVMEELEENTFCSEQKFLGAKLRVIAGEKELEPVPAIDEEDLIKLIGNVRQQVMTTGSALKRRLFDTARGYMITGAYLYPRLWNSMAEIITNTPSTVITMRLQSTTNGEMPELISMTGEEFEWPTSDGVPSIAFCKNVYLCEDNKLTNAEWVEIFPDLKEQLKVFRKKKEYLPHGKVMSNDWNDTANFEHDEEKIQYKRAPVLDVEEGAVLTNEHFRLPKHFVKFREVKSNKRKEDIIAERMESYESIHHQGLGVMFDYGDGFLTEQMLKLGFFPTPSGVWDRDPKKKMKKITSSWSYHSRLALMNYMEPNLSAIGESPVQSSIKPEADVAAEGVVVESYEFIKGLIAKWKFPAVDMDDISYVTSAFMISGAPLKPSSQVLSQSPSRVQITIAANGKIIGHAIATNKTVAKQKLYEKVREIITRPPEKTKDITKDGDVEENPGPNPVSISVVFEEEDDVVLLRDHEVEELTERHLFCPYCARPYTEDSFDEALVLLGKQGSPEAYCEGHKYLDLCEHQAVLLVDSMSLREMCAGCALACRVHENYRIGTRMWKRIEEKVTIRARKCSPRVEDCTCHHAEPLSVVWRQEVDLREVDLRQRPVVSQINIPEMNELVLE